jgi:hypothetical protein
MKIPTYWSKATAEGASPQGKPVAFSCWRSSDLSKADAHESALAAAKRILDALCRGQKLDRYAYGCMPLREEVMEKLSDAACKPIAAITRNLYGSLILNAERVMFVDIDFPPVRTGEATKHFFARLLGRKRKSPEAEREAKARNDVEQFMAANPQWNIRLYRTFAGLRAIVAHEVYDPKSSGTLDILRRLGCDPLYVRLCAVQQCFRARLTPKPWRCGHHANTLRYPVEDPQLLQRFEQWKAAYEARQRNYATCRFLGAMGNGPLHPEAEQVIELHDFVTRSNEPLALA